MDRHDSIEFAYKDFSFSLLFLSMAKLSILNSSPFMYKCINNGRKKNKEREKSISLFLPTHLPSCCFPVAGWAAGVVKRVVICWITKRVSFSKTTLLTSRDRLSANTLMGDRREQSPESGYVFPVRGDWTSSNAPSPAEPKRWVDGWVLCMSTPCFTMTVPGIGHIRGQSNGLTRIDAM